jgi:hypothetical protein
MLIKAQESSYYWSWILPVEARERAENGHTADIERNIPSSISQ